MQNFTYQVRTKVLFGRDTECKVGEEIKALGGSRILLHFGGGSAEKSGLLPRVRESLREAGLPFVELGGVRPNPRLSLVREGIELCKREGVDFLLAVGGGSVLDSAKAIGLGLFHPETDVWEFYERRATARGSTPLGVVLTIPAAGSETSESSVITNDDGHKKRGYSTPFNRPLFVAMNPALCATLPPHALACGVADIMMHTLDRYLVTEERSHLTDKFAEALLRDVIEFAPRAVRDPADYEAMSELLWAGSLSHNGLTGLGNKTDFAVHALGHELSGLFDATHGATLTAVWGSYWRYVMDANPGRVARYAREVWGLSTAEEGIRRTEEFWRSLGLPVSIPELLGRPVTEEEIKEMAVKSTFFGRRKVGVFKPLEVADLEQIYRLANR